MEWLIGLRAAMSSDMTRPETHSRGSPQAASSAYRDGELRIPDVEALRMLGITKCEGIEGGAVHSCVLGCACAYAVVFLHRLLPKVR